MERPPTAEESALNHTRTIQTIQYEFQDFFKKKMRVPLRVTKPPPMEDFEKLNLVN